MQSKYYHKRPDELEAFENDPDAQLWNYEYVRNRYWTSLRPEPQKTEFKGIERIQLGKLPPYTYKNCFEKQQKTYLEVKNERARAKERKEKSKILSRIVKR